MCYFLYSLRIAQAVGSGLVFITFSEGKCQQFLHKLTDTRQIQRRNMNIKASMCRSRRKSKTLVFVLN